MDVKYNEISRQLYGCDYNSVHMTEARKDLVRRIYDQRLKEKEKQ